MTKLKKPVFSAKRQSKNGSSLVFFGTENFSVPTLTKLLASSLNPNAGYSVLAVVTKPDSPSGRGRQIKSPKVKQIAERAGIRVYQPEKAGEIEGDLKKLQADCGVLVAYGKILPQKIIDIFPAGIVNVHPSLLPKYRGPSPIEAALLHGDKLTGISLMKLTAGMDEGPVYATKKVEIEPGINKPILADYLAVVGADFLRQKLPEVLDGSLKPRPQDESKASYTKLLTKDDSIMDFAKPAEVLEREVRAFAGWPKSVTRVRVQKIIVTKARVAKDEKDGDLVMRCHPGWLEIQELVAPSGRTMPAADFLRGYSSVR